jgi:carbon starvation protein
VTAERATTSSCATSPSRATATSAGASRCCCRRPLFGIANQLLAAIALVVATTIIIRTGRTRYAWVTLVPLGWLLAVTMSAGWLKIWSADPKLGFLAGADALGARIAAGGVPAEKIGELRTQMFNLRLDAAVTGFFMILVALIVLEAVRVWWREMRAPGGAVVLDVAEA